MDAETGFYYYGARYLDPKTSRWISADPALGDYIPGAGKGSEGLAGMGGVYNTVNLHLYHYAGNNPVVYTDPNGEEIRYADNVSPEFKANFEKIIDYLNKNGTSSLVAELEKRPETIYLDEGKNPGDQSFNPKTNTIKINPKYAFEWKKGKVISAALIFLHEAAHALQKLENPEKYNADRGKKIENYKNAEEKRVIQEVENPAAKKMNEPERDNHNQGKMIPVSDPTYSKNE
jgi:RHS repeat-associated protein